MELKSEDAEKDEICLDEGGAEGIVCLGGDYKRLLFGG